MNEVIQDYSTCHVINAPIARVFEQLTTLEGLHSWWEKPVKGEPAEKGIICFGFDRENEYSIMHVDAAQCGSFVQWTVVKDTGYGGAWEGTKIRFELETIGADMCILYFRHTGLNSDTRLYEDCKADWDSFLQSIARQSERTTV